ncbi:MAG: outer membrane protein assembly factor BamA [Candidatus Hydrogenedentes bacterium]|nr:outer membrane protein assembly factor BamA [Candidatus Hydrogenedentota bacterium]
MNAKHLVGMLVWVLVAAGVSVAQDYEGRNVDEVRFRGLERVSEQAVLSKMELKPGAPFSRGAVTRDIRRLYELNYFDTVNIGVTEEAGKLVLQVDVKEKRVVEEVRIIGNRKIKDRAIRAVLSMREGDSFLPESYDQERQAILNLYESKGFANTIVDAVAENIGASRVRLIYTITEGKKARIRSINIEGNQALSDRRLRKSMKTKKAWWFLGGKYEEEKFEADLETIVNEYGNIGRLEAQVTKTDLVYTPNGKGINVTIFVEEGPEYTMDSLEVAGNKVYDTDELMDQVKVKPGAIHNKGQVAKDIENLQKTYQDSGYVDAAVTPQVVLDRDRKVTRVTYRVEEGDLKYLHEIRVTGNSVTKDEIIRRQMLVIPGDRYDGEAVEKSRQRIQNTQFFDTVRVTLEDPSAGSVSKDLFTDLNVDVEEGKTGTFNFGGGYSTEDGVGVYTELRLNNFDIGNWPKFSGGGQQLRLRINTATRRDNYAISFTEPQFLGYPISFGVDAYRETYEVRGGANYTEDSTGGQLRLGKNLSPYVFTQVGFRAQNTDISDLPTFINREIKRQEGDSTTLSTTWRIERNTLDSRIDATSGAVHALTVEVAGFGGDHNFIKAEHDSTWYKSLGEKKKWVLSLRTREGVMTEYGDSDYVPLQDRFYAGGSNTVRGYRNRDIGPKVREYWFWGDTFSVGGNARLLGTVEAKYKITDILRVYAFMDAGGVWADTGEFDFGDMRYSAGVGLGFNVPMLGPIRVDYGYPLNPDDDQSSSGRLHLATGYKF